MLEDKNDSRIILSIVLVTVFACPSFAADFESRLSGLEETLKNQQTTIEEQQKLIEQLREELATVKKQEVTAISEKPAETKEGQKTSGISGLFGGSWMTNPYISLYAEQLLLFIEYRRKKLRKPGNTRLFHPGT